MGFKRFIAKVKAGIKAYREYGIEKPTLLDMVKATHPEHLKIPANTTIDIPIDPCATPVVAGFIIDNTVVPYSHRVEALGAVGVWGCFSNHGLINFDLIIDTKAGKATVKGEGFDQILIGWRK